MPEDLTRYYAILDLTPDAAPDAIRESYTDLVKVWHPDRFPVDDRRLRRKAEDKLKLINEAYQKIRASRKLGGPTGERRLLVPLDFGGRWGYVDESGIPVIYPEFAAARGFSEGLAAVRVVEHWGFIDTEGHFAVNSTYEEVGDFSEGLAAVRWYGRWGYIDRTGCFAVHPRYQGARPFRGGWGEVQMGMRWGRINRAGEVVFAEMAPARQL